MSQAMQGRGWMPIAVAILAVAGLGKWAAPAARAEGWTVDFGAPRGIIRPLHGVNGGPLCYRGTVDLRDRHRELGIPLTRLHDTTWLNAEAVDVHTIFRDFRADPGDPASYDFRVTDDYVRAVREAGSEVVFRLGESIEHTERKYWVHPPSDPDRWAAVAVGIVRHYSEGWAGGPTNAVRYWEIWNEPDVRPAMWTGTDDEFLRLFETTARAIRSRFPQAKIGGPGFGGVGDFGPNGFHPTPFVARFLRQCRERRVPLDFFSWHRYTADAEGTGRLARAVRALLDTEGFAGTESHLNEWNYLPDDDWGPMLKGGDPATREAWYARMNGAEGAAFAAGMLIRLQDWPVDAANYYTGEIQGFGLFTIHGAPKKTFHAFRAFRGLLETPVRVGITWDGPEVPPAGLVATAGRASTGKAGGILLVNEARSARSEVLRLRSVPWGDESEWEAMVVDASRDGVVGERGSVRGAEGALTVELPGQSVVLVRIRPPAGAAR